MTYFVTALENTRARLIVSESRTTDAAVADLIAAHLAAQGHIVIRRTEG